MKERFVSHLAVDRFARERQVLAALLALCWLLGWAVPVWGQSETDQPALVSFPESLKWCLGPRH